MTSSQGFVNGFRLTPTVDGRVLPTAFWTDTAPAVSANVPMIVGINLNGFVNGVDNTNGAKMTDVELIAKLTEHYHDKVAAITRWRRMGPVTPH
jgi:para-nitrobenzyl esterase